MKAGHQVKRSRARMIAAVVPGPCSYVAGVNVKLSSFVSWGPTVTSCVCVPSFSCTLR